MYEEKEDGLDFWEHHRQWNSQRTVYPASSRTTKAATAWQPVPEPVRRPEPPIPDRAIAEPGFHIVRRPGTREEIKRRLFPYSLTAATEAMFERLNPHLGGYILPGEMVVLADPYETLCTAEEQFLLEEAQKVYTTLQQLSPEQRQFMVDYWQPLQDIAVTGERSGSNGMAADSASLLGTLSAAGSRLMRETTQALQRIDELYRQVLDPSNPMTRERFHAERARLFQRLSLAMNHWVNEPLRLPRHPALKDRIQVEARQQLHEYRTARNAGPFGIPTISETIAKVTVVDRLMSLGAAVGIGLDIAATQTSINQACRDGREMECRRAQFVEYGGLAGRSMGSGGGAALGTVMTTPSSRICLSVAGLPHGRIACSIIGSAGGAVAGESVMGGLGKQFGDVLHSGVYGWAAEEEDASGAD
ncbi:hypothetical protein [Billgrantia kenyensis]|uniref:Uncharacterized protein n=1 Tax=Billgrantia kenyensis TaxID=321266 RepID=A0A7V9W0T4_9GAMM|nr:hypothetical protein [Halomonas kenyensis]MBA2778969.1 hypothetical protein [Halomonas kenyensis]MCG6662896.1 hypothetical protein [Halomonas kenyensis]